MACTRDSLLPLCLQPRPTGDIDLRRKDGRALTPYWGRYLVELRDEYQAVWTGSNDKLAEVSLESPRWESGRTAQPGEHFMTWFQVGKLRLSKFIASPERLRFLLNWTDGRPQQYIDVPITVTGRWRPHNLLLVLPIGVLIALVSGLAEIMPGGWTPAAVIAVLGTAIVAVLYFIESLELLGQMDEFRDAADEDQSIENLTELASMWSDGKDDKE